MTRPVSFAGPLLCAAAVTAGVLVSLPVAIRTAGYVPAAEVRADDTLRVRLVKNATRAGKASRVFGAIVPGYLSARGLPPKQGRFTLTDSGLVFRSIDGDIARFPLVGSGGQAAGRPRRPPTLALAYIDEAGGRPTYVFRIDAGVFETDVPGPLLDVASHPGWLDSVGAGSWVKDQPLVRPGDSTALWATVRAITAGAYADSLYQLFGSPRAGVGLIGPQGQRAGRLGEYVARKDSLAFDPGRMTGHPQLRHTLAHEMGHRWQAWAPNQIATLWRGVPPMRDPRRYGYGNASEHQAEAVAFAVDFLQTTARIVGGTAGSLTLLDHYELLVPGTRTMVRYLSLQPIYRRHPLRTLLAGALVLGQLLARTHQLQPPFHLGIHLLPQLPQSYGVAFQRLVDRRGRFPGRHRRGPAGAVQPHEDDDAVAGAAPFAGLGVARVHVHRDIEAAAAGPDHQRPQLHQLTHEDGTQEMEPAQVDRHAVAAGPAGGAGVAGLVDPLHHRTAVHLAAEVDVARFRQKPEGHATLPLHLGPPLIGPPK